MSRISEYQVNNSAFRVLYADITSVDAEALVSSDDNYISMGGGVSASIRRRGGEVIAEEARKHAPVPLGDIAITSAGKLSAKYIFHAITIDYSKMEFAKEEHIQSATLKSLKMADFLGITSLAFPALGTGVAGIPFSIVADAMVRTIAEYLSDKTNILTVSLTLFAREHVRDSDLDLFYERAVALASLSTQSKRTEDLLGKLEIQFRNSGRNDLLERIRSIRSDLSEAQIILSENPKNPNRMEEIQKESNIHNIIEEVVQVSSDTHENTEWNDKLLEANVLRTKLSGLFTQLNVNTSNLNKFEIEKAKYGGHLTPPRLDTSIDESKEEIMKLEKQVKDTREQLSKLVGA